MTQELFSYFGAFPKCRKMRPGFRNEDGILWVLTHTAPKDKVYYPVNQQNINSEHFSAKGPVAYLTRADNQEATRYNNVPGGTIFLNHFLTKSNIMTHIFLATTPQFLASLTIQSLGLSEKATEETLVDLRGIFGALCAGKPTTEEQNAYLALPTFGGIAENFQRLQITNALLSTPLVGELKEGANLNDIISALQEKDDAGAEYVLLQDATGMSFTASAAATDEELTSVTDTPEVPVVDATEVPEFSVVDATDEPVVALPTKPQAAPQVGVITTSKGNLQALAAAATKTQEFALQTLAAAAEMKDAALAVAISLIPEDSAAPTDVIETVSPAEVASIA